MFTFIVGEKIIEHEFKVSFEANFGGAIQIFEYEHRVGDAVAENAWCMNIWNKL